MYGLDIGSDITPDLDQALEGRLQQLISQAWENNKDARVPHEERMLKDLRQRNGEYDPNIIQDIRAQGGSEIFMMITGTKCRGLNAWIRDIMLHDIDKPWGLEPTKIPSLPAWAQQAVMERIGQVMNQDGEPPEDMVRRLSDMLMEEIVYQSKEAAKRMEKVIQDQLQEADWRGEMEKFVDDFVTFSNAFIKGPVFRNKKRLKWESRFGGMMPVISTTPQITFKRVSPFDIYPSPNAETVNDGELIEHIRFTRGELYNLIGLDGYLEDQIRDALAEYGEGGLRHWMWSESERAYAEGKERWWMNKREGLIDAINYWGFVQGRILTEWGVPVKDEDADYHVNAIKVGRFIVKLKIHDDPLGRRPYHTASFENIPGSFWGKSLPYTTRDIQQMCNAAARSLANNMAFASGPQVEIDYERLSPTETEIDLHPWKVWQTSGSQVGGGKAVNFFQPSSNAAELLGVFETFERKADEATGVPRYSYGSEKVGGAGRTASGLSMLMSSAARGVKAAIGNIDSGVIRPTVEMLYYHNMMTYPDSSIKGDSQVVPKGSTAMVAKEMAQVRRNEFLQITSNPMDIELMGPEGRATLLRELEKGLDLTERVIPDESTLKQRLASAPKQPNPEEIKLQAQREQIQANAQMKLAELEFKAEQDEKRHQRELEKLRQEREINLKELERKDASEKEKLRIQERYKREELRLKNEYDERKLEMEMQTKRLEIDAQLQSQEGCPELSDKDVNINITGGATTEQPRALEGPTRKHIKINRGPDKLMESLDVEER